MSNEIRSINQTGNTLYAHLLNSSGQRWNGSAFETYASGHYSTYVITMTEQGSSGGYFANFPSAITGADHYEYFVYAQAGGSAAEGDRIIGTGTVNWNGTTASDVVAGSMSGTDFLAYVKRIFLRTDKDTVIYDAVTDSIQELRRIYPFDESQVEKTTTAQITVAGQYLIAIESDLSLFVGDVVVVDTDDSFVLRKLSKPVFDLLYPNPAATTVVTDKPQDYAIFAGNIYLGPVPDKTTYTYRVNYSKIGGTIDATTTSVPFTKYYREALREGVLSKVYADLDRDRAQDHTARWEFFKEQAISREENLQKGTGIMLQFDV